MMAWDFWEDRSSAQPSCLIWPHFMGGELSKREGVLLRSFHNEAMCFCCFFNWFMQIDTLITISFLDIGFKWCFVIFSFFLRGCFCQWEGAPVRSGGARAPSRPLILHPCPLSREHNSRYARNVGFIPRPGCRLLNVFTVVSWISYERIAIKFDSRPTNRS